jgi:hypothetical protein
MLIATKVYKTGMADEKLIPTGFTKNHRKLDSFRFKTQIPNFMNGSQLASRFDRLAGQFSIQDSNSKFD